MKEYDIYKIDTNDSALRYIIFSTSHISPLKYINEIEEDLSRITTEKIEIVFDLLLSSGNSKERFGKVVYNGQSIDRKSFDYLEISKRDELRRFSTQYYMHKKGFVENSILNSVQRKMILRGITI